MTTINSQDDFLRALSENPEWKAAVRAQILGEELLQLPARFDAFVEQMAGFVAEMKEFVAKQEQHNAEMTRFVAEQKEINAELARFVAEQKEINTRVELRLDGLGSDLSGLRTEVGGLSDRVDGIAKTVDRLTIDSGRTKGHYAREAAIREAELIAMDMGLEYVRIMSTGDLARMVLMAAQGKPLSPNPPKGCGLCVDTRDDG